MMKRNMYVSFGMLISFLVATAAVKFICSFRIKKMNVLYVAVVLHVMCSHNPRLSESRYGWIYSI